MPPDSTQTADDRRQIESWPTIKRFLPYLWPREDASLRRRIVIAMGLVLAGKGVTLALPFAYLHFRSGSITGYVFGGVMIGISFFLLNNVFGYIGNLNQWQPWLAAASPALIYSVVSLGAFGWLVLRR